MLDIMGLGWQVELIPTLQQFVSQGLEEWDTMLLPIGGTLGGDLKTVTNAWEPSVAWSFYYPT
jgi:hypothetical protein